jgi:hypothetical protein
MANAGYEWFIVHRFSNGDMPEKLCSVVTHANDAGEVTTPSSLHIQGNSIEVLAESSYENRWSGEHIIIFRHAHAWPRAP